MKQLQQKVAPEFGIERHVVDSTSIVSVGWCPKTNVLEIEFPKGSLYRYSDVDRDAYADFVRAESLGTHFQTKIRGVRPCRKVNTETGALEPLKPKAASAKQLDYVSRLLFELKITDGFRNEHCNASMDDLARNISAPWYVGGSEGRIGNPMLVDTWLGNLTAEQAARAIEYLKARK